MEQPRNLPPGLQSTLNSIPPYSSGLTNNLNFLSSETFEIIAESGEKSFHVHGKILATQSDPLRSITTGVWKESTERKVDLSDWDSDTVGKFLQFLYVGDYQVSEGILEGAGGGEVEGRGQDGANISDTAWWGPGDIGLGASSDVLLVHAKVYALAQYKDVESLRLMALERLGAMLGGIKAQILRWDTPRDSRPGSLEGMAKNVIELLRYTYSHTDSLTNSEEPMRKLVLRFVAGNLQSLKLMDQREMGSLLGEGGDLAAELVQVVLGRLLNTEEELCRAEDRLSKAKDELGECRMECSSRANEVMVVKENLRVAQSGMQTWKNHVVALNEKVRQLEISSTQKEDETLELERLLKEARAVGSKSKRWEGMSRMFFISLASVSILIAVCCQRWQTSYSQPKPTYEKPEATHERSFEGICAYYEARSWTGSTFVTAIGDPWIRSDVYKLDGKPLRQYCEDAGYTKRPVSKRSSSKKSHSTSKPPAVPKESLSTRPPVSREAPTPEKPHAQKTPPTPKTPQSPKKTQILNKTPKLGISISYVLVLLVSLSVSSLALVYYYLYPEKKNVFIKASHPPTQIRHRPPRPTSPSTQTCHPPAGSISSPIQNHLPLARPIYPPIRTTNPPAGPIYQPGQNSHPFDQPSRPPAQASHPPIQTSRPPGLGNQSVRVSNTARAVYPDPIPGPRGYIWR